MTPERWKRITTLFHAAGELPAEEVDSYLDRECAGDPDLYREVRLMLDHDEKSGLPDVSPWSNPELLPTDSAMTGAFHKDEVVAERYRIVRLLGQGGMGEVYEVEDMELGERVALKTLLPEIASDARMIARFKQEIQLSRKVGHRNVCRMFDLSWHPLDATAGATYFLTMELLAGETLSDRLRAAPMAWDKALPLLKQMAAGLDAAHAAGVIHRDFKPSNVMLVDDSQGCRAVITDFGLARSASPADGRTATSRVMGTYEYMAPELLSGRGSASVASDVYALGLVACKVLTGAPPSATRLKQLPAAAEAAILQAVDEKPAARFASAGDFGRALSGDASKSITLTISPRVRRMAALSAAAVAVLLAAAGWWAWTRYFGGPSPDAMALYRKGVAEIGVGTYFAATRTLRDAVAAAPRFPMAHARMAEAWLELQSPERAKDEMLAARRAAGWLASNDRLQLEAIDLAVARDYPAAATRWEQIARSDSKAFAIELGRAYEKADRGDQAIATYQRAAEADHNPAAWLRLAVTRVRSGKPGADTAFQSAEDWFRAANNFEGVIETLFQRGVAANRRGDYAQATANLQKAREVARMAGHAQQAVSATLQLATTAYMTNDVESSERYAREGLDEAVSNQMDALAITGMISLGQARMQKRAFADAESWYRNALGLAERTGSFGMAAMCQLRLANYYDQQSRPDEALRNATAASKYYEANGYAAESAAALLLIARYLRDHGQHAEALDTLTKAAAFAEKSRSRVQISQAASTLGSLLAGQERYPEALEAYRKNLDPATDPTSLAYAGLQCGNMLRQLGRTVDARQMFDRADLLAAKIPTLALKIRRSRAALALVEGAYADAIAGARGILAEPNLEAGERFEATRILGLALMESGKKADGRKLCETLPGLVVPGNSAMAVDARLALLAARVDSGDRSGAATLASELDSLTAALPESRWRALALAARLDPARWPASRSALEALGRLWDRASYELYLKRRDISALAHPLLNDSAAIPR